MTSPPITAHHRYSNKTMLFCSAVCALKDRDLCRLGNVKT
jgi:hypothetical protein